MIIFYKKENERIPDPKQHSAEAAGFDLSARHSYVLPAERITSVHTGLYIGLPPLTVGLIFERSSLHKKGLGLANKVGVIDSDYRGEIILLVHNHHKEPIWLPADERIAQILFLPMHYCTLLEVDELSKTERGSGGFGSTDNEK